MTVVDEAVTVVDDPTVQCRVRGLSVGQGNTAGCAALRSSSVMLMRWNRTKEKRDKESTEGERISLSLPFNDFIEALYLQYVDLWLLYCYSPDVVFATLRPGNTNDISFGWPFFSECLLLA